MPACSLRMPKSRVWKSNSARRHTTGGRCTPVLPSGKRLGRTGLKHHRQRECETGPTPRDLFPCEHGLFLSGLMFLLAASCSIEAARVVGGRSRHDWIADRPAPDVRYATGIIELDERLNPIRPDACIRPGRPVQIITGLRLLWRRITSRCFCEPV